MKLRQTRSNRLACYDARTDPFEEGIGAHQPPELDEGAHGCGVFGVETGGATGRMASGIGIYGPASQETCGPSGVAGQDRELTNLLLSVGC